MKDFLAVSDLSPDGVRDLLDLAIRLKQEYVARGNPPLFKGKVLAMIFQKPSLRTRVSFDMAMRHMGGDALYLSPSEIGLGKRESTADIARVLSGYLDGLVIRTNQSLEEMRALADQDRMAIVNALSEDSHPTQALADLSTIREARSRINSSASGRSMNQSHNAGLRR